MAKDTNSHALRRKAAELRAIAAGERDTIIKQVLLDLARFYDEEAGEVAGSNGQLSSH